MNKNLFKTFAIAAMAVLAGACAKEQVGPSDGETTEVSFNVEVPGVSMVTKGISDAASVNELICQLFIKEGNDYKLIQTYNAPVEAKKASLNMTLVKKQRYYVAFWAQAKGTGYYNTENLQSVTINYDAVKANDPQMDAFWSSVELNLPALTEAELKKKTNVTLYRAVAQVNFGSKTFDRADALSVKESTISMTGVPNIFNALFGAKDNAYSGSVDQVTYKTNATITGEKLVVGGTNYDYLATAYVFASKLGSLTTASAKFTLTNGKSTTVDLANVPIKRNMRTNILGNLLTFDAEWHVTVDSEFKGGNEFYDPVGSAIEKGGEVTLEDDFSVVPNSYGLVIKKGVSTVLNLNGKKFENRNGDKNNKAALQVRGKLTINGDGDVICEGGADNNAVLVEDGGQLIINGGTYYVEKDANGKSNSTIYARKACTIEINGGVFSAEPNAEGKTPYVLNQDDDITVNCFSVKGGIFVGFNPAEVNENKGAITSFVADGYKAVGITYEGKQAWKVEAIPAVTTQDGLNDAIADVAEGETATVYLGAGEFTTYDNTSLKGKNVTVSYVGAGADKTTFAVGTDNHTKGEANGDYSLDGVTKASFKNMTIKVDNDNYRGYIRVKELEFENCVFENRISYWGVGKVTFKNCTFNQTADDYNLWTYSGKDFLFDGCVFNSPGKCINAYKSQPVEYTITIKDCTFNSSNSSKEIKSVVELKYNGGKKYSLKLEGTNNCTNFSVSEKTGSKLYNCNLIDKNHTESGYEQDSIVYIDGKKVWENGAKVE